MPRNESWGPEVMRILFRISDAMLYNRVKKKIKKEEKVAIMKIF